MKTTLLFFLLIFSLTIQAQKKYKVSRYEETPVSLFICLNSTTTPCYIEHQFTANEMATALTRRATIENLIAELQLNDDAYKSPLTVTYKVQEAENIKPDTANVRRERLKILLKRKAASDSIAKAELLKLQPTETEIVKYK